MKKLWKLGLIGMCMALLVGCTGSTKLTGDYAKEESDKQNQELREIAFSNEMFVRGGVARPELGSSGGKYVELITSVDALEESVTKHKLEESLLDDYCADFFKKKDILVMVFGGNTELGYYMKSIQREDEKVDIYLDWVFPGAGTSYHDMGTNYTYAVEVEKGELTRDCLLQVHVRKGDKQDAVPADIEDGILRGEHMFCSLRNVSREEYSGENTISLLTSADEMRTMAADRQVELSEAWQSESFFEDKDVLWVTFQGKSGLAYCLTDIERGKKSVEVRMKEICPAVMMECKEEYAEYVYAVAVGKGRISVDDACELKMEDADPVSLKHAEIRRYGTEDRKLGFIKKVNQSEGKMLIEFDNAELAVDEENPNDIYVKNDEERIDSYVLNEDAGYRIWDGRIGENVERDAFVEYVKDVDCALFWITLRDDEVVQIEEQLMP